MTYPRTPARPAIERFWDHVQPEPNSGCWLWDGAQIYASETNPTLWYGAFVPDCKKSGSNRVHRWAYEHFIGPIPPGMHVRHKCGIGCCVNPDHFYLGQYRGGDTRSGKRSRKPLGSARKGRKTRR